MESDIRSSIFLRSLMFCLDLFLLSLILSKSHNIFNSSFIYFFRIWLCISFTVISLRSFISVACTGWGKITSINFKVNNKKTIPDTKKFIFGFWNYNMESFKSHSLKKNILQVVAVVCVVFACRAPGRLRNGPYDSFDVLWCSRGPWSSSSFFQTHFPFPWSSQPTTEWVFGPVLGPEWGFGSEYGTHAALLR